LLRTRRPHNVIHRSARFAKFNRGRGIPLDPAVPAFGECLGVGLFERLGLSLGVAALDRVNPLLPELARLLGDLACFGKPDVLVAAQPHLPRLAAEHVAQHPRLRPGGRDLQVEAATIVKEARSLLFPDTQISQAIGLFPLELSRHQPKIYPQIYPRNRGG
jgi:hypothetical protein